jgi:hypothetical protein
LTRQSTTPTWPYGTRYPKSGTEAARDYWVSAAQIDEFAAFILRMARHIEHLAPALLDMELVLANTDEQRQAIKEKQDSWRGPFSELSAHVQFHNEVFLVRHIENYLSYLAALLFKVFCHRPETMRSAEKVDLDFILEHQSFDSLIQGLAEKKVEALSYSSFDRLAQFFKDRFNLSICPTTDRPLVREYIETRNISVHNRCRISRRYLEKVPESTRKLGATRFLGIADIDQLVSALHRAVSQLDRDARRHLKLPGIRFDVSEIQAEEHESGFARYQENLRKLKATARRTTARTKTARA